MTKKCDALGISYGAACNRLRKNLLFTLASRLGLLNCHRCGGMIETVAEFSIDHITAWENSGSPIDIFFDVENIAFSHLRCNIAAASKDAQRIYSSKQEKSRKNFRTYYEKNKKEWNARRNERRRKKTDKKPALV